MPWDTLSDADVVAVLRRWGVAPDEMADVVYDGKLAEAFAINEANLPHQFAYLRPQGPY